MAFPPGAINPMTGLPMGIPPQLINVPMPQMPQNAVNLPVPQIPTQAINVPQPQGLQQTVNVPQPPEIQDLVNRPAMDFLLQQLIISATEGDGETFFHGTKADIPIEIIPPNNFKSMANWCQVNFKLLLPRIK